MNILLNENKYRTGGVNLNYRSKKFLGFSWIIIFLAGIYIIVFGVKNLTKNACKELCSDIRKNVWSDTIQLSTKMLFPIIDYTAEMSHRNYLRFSRCMDTLLPIHMKL